jgi:hypothetical protein
MDIKEIVKSIVKDTVHSFTTDGFHCVEREDYDHSEVHLRVIDFYKKYKSIYNVRGNKNTPPICFMFHVLGVTDSLRTIDSFDNEEFISCVIELYRQSGVKKE